MEPRTCPHLTCGHTWTPRKANPKKCPQCQNPLWRSSRPKMPKVDIVYSQQENWPASVVAMLDEAIGSREGSSSVVERPSAKVSDDEVGLSDDNAEGGSSVQIPASPHSENDSLSDARKRAEALFARLSECT